MAERGCPLEAVPLPAEVRESLAELELELSEGDITQKGYEKKRGKLLARYVPLAQGVDPSLQAETRIPGPSQATAPVPEQQKTRPSHARDERFRSDVHTEAVQAALAKYKERKMPMPSKRRSVLTHMAVEAYTPPDTSSASEDEDCLQRPGRLASAPLQSHAGVAPWLDQAVQGSPASSAASCTSSHPGGRPAAVPSAAAVPAGPAALARVADLHSAPPDVTTGLAQHQHTYCERPQLASMRGAPRGGSRSVLETAGGVPVSSRVSSKIQQLLNTLKKPKRPPLKEFFVDDLEEVLEVQQPDPGQPKPEGGQTAVLKGELLAVGSTWPPSLLATLQQWGTTQPKAPCLTALDTTGKAVYTLTYGKLWSRSLKLAYTLLNKLTSKNEPLLKPGDRVALVFPNSDPVMFTVAFYGCLLAELVPVPIEVPLTRKDAGSQQVGFLLGSCGVALALTTDACQKGLPKAQTGEVAAFKGWPPLTWLVIDGKHLTKPPKDWHPSAQDAGAGTAYIEYKTSKEGSTVGVAVSHASLLAQCQALTQACGYSEAETLTNVLDFKRDAGLWHGVLTSVMNRMHVVSIPYALMKANPLSWIQKVCAYKARAALVKSRDMHWSLLAQRGQRDVSLSSLRLLVVADGANPWSISSCDAFLNVFQARGLRPEVICPCASSPEALTVAIRRPPDLGGPPPRRAVLSMSCLSHGVIRLDAEEKLSVLTVQDVGQVMPGANVCVVKVEGTPYLCKTDEVGEICVNSSATATAYYGLLGITKNIFETVPVTAGGTPVSDRPFTRTGLLGFIGPDNLVFVVGKLDGLMVVGVRRHNADDIVATALAVEPMKFVYRGRIAVFSVTVLHDDRIVLVAEQRPDASEEDSFQWMSRVLQGTVTSTTTCIQLHKKAERVAAALMEKARLTTGAHVALVYPPGVDLIAAFYGCLYCGCVPVTVRPPHPQNLATTLPTVKMIVEVSKSACVLTTQAITRLLRSKEALAAVDVRTWPTILDTDDIPKKKVASIFRPPSPDVLAYLDFSVSTTGILAGVKMSHAATSALCRAIKLQCELYPSRQIAICLDPYCGLGFALWCLCSVYSGHQSVLVPPPELETNVSLWLWAVSQYKARVTFCSYSVMEMCARGLGAQTAVLRVRAVRAWREPRTSPSSRKPPRGAPPPAMKGVNLSCVRTCMVVAEERPRIALTQSFSKLFRDLGLPARAVSTTFGCRVNVAICLQGTAGPDPTTVYVDMRALRHDRVRLVERGSPHSLPLTESGKILPGVKVIIAHSETRGPLGDSHLGEVWVSSPHSATGYYTVYGEEGLHADHFSARLSFGDTQTVWARTGFLGFLRRTELTDASGERHDALYVVGSLDEMLELRGMRYHPVDIETSVVRAHRSIAECAVFTWTNLLVVVVELDGLEQDALDLVALVTNVVLEEHHLVVGVVVIVDPGVIPINSRGEKQRMHLRDGFLADQLDPIYVAYNM
ncbi:disco-interacting protein 2 homolog A isoform X11 [Sagmatias obliquidens]|uniref:disco-interacting protein 2 homolog A isoform X11 n=1 Tax=Sagmatias obliquidens TaxID=3371155 RepID=UPI000F441161|nr:disco-interacting protein 2 homolog A isoform X11 [Lagenorhynchus obliquidens]